MMFSLKQKGVRRRGQNKYETPGIGILRPSESLEPTYMEHTRIEAMLGARPNMMRSAVQDPSPLALVFPSFSVLATICHSKF